MKRGEQGLTLIELLVTLAILSIIGTIVWKAFFQGYNFSQKSISKNFIIQEANNLTFNLKKIHQESDKYDLIYSSSSCDISVDSWKYNTSTPPVLVLQPKKFFEQSQICLKITELDVLEVEPDPNEIDPNLYDVSITITASDRKNPENNVKIKSVLYKVKGASYYD